MRTLKKTRGKYLMVLLAMCGLVASALGILTNTAGLFFTPIAQSLWEDSVRDADLASPGALLGAWQYVNTEHNEDIRLTLNKDQTCSLTVNGSAAEGSWRYQDGVFALSVRNGEGSGAYTTAAFDPETLAVILSGGDAAQARSLSYTPATAGVNLTLTISNLVFALAGMVSARFVRENNFKFTLTAGTIIFAGCTAALSLCHSLWALYLLNAARGFAAGMIGNVLATTVIGYWFWTDTGFISSLALGFSGLVGALFNPVFEAVISASGWRVAYLVSAGVILALNLPAILTPITLRPEDSNLSSLKAEAPADAGGVSRVNRAGSSKSFAVLAVALCAISFASLVTSTPQLFKSLAGTYGLAATGVTMMTVTLIANTAGKFLFGAMTDRLGVKISVLIYGAVIAAGVALLVFVHQPASMLVSAACMGLSYSIPTVGGVMISRELFSPERYSQVFPKINLGATIANALGYPLLGAIYDATHSYAGALLLVCAVTLLSMAGVVLAYRLADREKKNL